MLLTSAFLDIAAAAMHRWWNPAAEMQAIDRTHRLGQFKPIYATRFIIEDTVEERIIKLQASIWVRWRGFPTVRLSSEYFIVVVVVVL